MKYQCLRFCWLNVKQLSAWKNITTLPHALESTLSLLVVIAQDVPQSALPSHLSLRQSYATAIIRLVNGLVDPLQVGAYARSIASIATQLGFPSWLVELRHAATHEDLPSIDLLREAARQVNNYLSWHCGTLLNLFTAVDVLASPQLLFTHHKSILFPTAGCTPIAFTYARSETIQRPNENRHKRRIRNRSIQARHCHDYERR